MNARQVFGVVVRSAGLAVSIAGIWTLAGVLLMYTNEGMRELVALMPLRNTMLQGGLMLVIGLVLMRFANQVVAFAYARPEGAQHLI